MSDQPHQLHQSYGGPAAATVAALPHEPAEPSPDPAPEGPAAPAGPEPLGVTVPPTGNADVDAAVGRLADADELPTQAHIEVYEDVHGGLRAALAELDENRS